MAKVVKIIGYSVLGVVGVGVVAVGGGYFWAKSAHKAAITQVYEVHEVDFPVPWPLTDAEIAELRAEKQAELDAAKEAEAIAVGTEAGGAVLTTIAGAAVAPAEPEPEIDPLEGVDLGAIAMERAVARGQHLVNARYACVACHGADFSGGTMVDDPAMGQWFGKNLTTGKGSAIADYTPRDWDRIVRHGVKPDGTGAIMPSDDFTRMSDQELSDIVAFMRSLPPVDNEVPDPTYGLVSTALIATNTVTLTASRVGSITEHPAMPPETAVTLEFGRHITGVCQGCHRHELEGGKIDIGPPDWPPAGNLTATNEALHALTFEQFDTLMRTATWPDGRKFQAPMSEITPIAANITETEMRAMFTYIKSLEAKPTGK